MLFLNKEREEMAVEVAVIGVREGSVDRLEVAGGEKLRSMEHVEHQHG